jgi:DNA-binding CsgD family transcriptional regulator/anti-anti-sigma regulatory factor
MSLAIDTARDLDSGATTVRLDGELTFASARTVQSALDTCAGERPTAVIVDLTSLDVGHAALLAVFADASERAAGQWGVPVLLCCGRPDVVRKIRVFRAFPEVYSTRGEAMDAVHGRVLLRRQQRFPPAPGSAALARHHVGTACAEWNLASLRQPAVLVASELASNAIEHAGTELDVSVSFTGVYLRIAVQDGSTSMPQLITHRPGDPAAWHRGRGLHLVADTAAAWNTTSIAGGKIVWALLRAPSSSTRGGDGPAAANGDHRDNVQDLVEIAPSRHAPTTPPHTPSQQHSPVADEFSDRELEVLRYLPTTLTTAEIAPEMQMAVNTVKAHIRSIHRKLGVSRRHDAVVRAIERGLLQ